MKQKGTVNNTAQIKVKCRSCKHQWSIGAYPIDVKLFFIKCRDARCPKCDTDSKGIAIVLNKKGDDDE